MTLSRLTKLIVPPVFAATTVFAAMTVPLAAIGDKQININFQGETLFFGKLRDVALPYVVIATGLSLGAGISTIAMYGWRKSSRKSAEIEQQLSQLEKHLQHKEELLKELLADKKSQHFEADVAPEVVARFLSLGFEMTFNRLHKICIFCVRRDWQHELPRSIELRIFFLERVPKKTLNEALAKAFMNCCANFAVKKIPNMIYNMLSIVLGVPIIHNCYLCDMTRALKPEEFGQKSEKLTPRSLKTFAMKSTNKFLSKYDNVAGYHIEKIVRFPFLPNALKRDLLWPKNTHTTIKKWKDEMRHYCDDHREDREELRKEHTQMTETIGKFFLQKLVKEMSRKGLFEEGDKVEDFVFEMLKKPLCGGVSPPWQNPFDDDILSDDCEHL